MRPASTDNPSRSQSRFEQLYADHGGRIFRFCHRLCANRADAEDLAQDVFVAAYRALPRFAGRSAVTTWLYGITLTRWRSIRSRRRVTVAPLGEGDSDMPSLPDNSDECIQRIVMDQAMAALPDMQREALLLVKGEGLTCREAAESLGVPEGTVKTRVYQAIQKLQAALAEGETTQACPSGRKEKSHGKS